MTEIFKAAIERGASDVHIKAGDVVRARILGKLIPLTQQKLSPDQVKQLAIKLIPREDDRARIDEIYDYDCSWGLPGLGRFRVNILRQRGSFMIVLRVVPIEVPTIDGLGLPPVLKQIAESERGLILVTGVTGSGKSSMLAGIVSARGSSSREPAPCTSTRTGLPRSIGALTICCAVRAASETLCAHQARPAGQKTAL